jgi:hypothetical protein
VAKYFFLASPRIQIEVRKHVSRPNSFYVAAKTLGERCGAQLSDMDIEEKCQGSSSFLKKRTKKLLFVSVRVNRCGRVKQASKSFLVLFFKKELLPCFAGVQSGMFQSRT